MGADLQLVIGGVSLPQPEVAREIERSAAVATWTFQVRTGRGRKLGRHKAEGETRGIAEHELRLWLSKMQDEPPESFTLESPQPMNPQARQADELEGWAAQADDSRPRERSQCFKVRTIERGGPRIGVDLEQVPTGLRVTAVHPFSPAAMARLEIGDVIVQAGPLAAVRDIGTVEQLRELVQAHAEMVVIVQPKRGDRRGVVVQPEPRRVLDPCPFVQCQHHLWGASLARGELERRTIQFAQLVESKEPEEWGETCALDVADAVDAGDSSGAPGPRWAGGTWEAHEVGAEGATPSETDGLDHAVTGRLAGVSREQVRLDEHDSRTRHTLEMLGDFASRVGPLAVARVVTRVVAVWDALDVSVDRLAERARVGRKALERMRTIAALPETEASAVVMPFSSGELERLAAALDLDLEDLLVTERVEFKAAEVARSLAAKLVANSMIEADEDAVAERIQAIVDELTPKHSGPMHGPIARKILAYLLSDAEVEEVYSTDGELIATIVGELERIREPESDTAEVVGALDLFGGGRGQG